MKKACKFCLGLATAWSLLPMQALAAGEQILPATGDKSPVLPVTILMVLSAVGIVVMVALARRDRGK